MPLTFFAEFHGLLPNSKALVEVDTMNLGGDDPQGILTPTDVVLGLEANKYSPLLLKAFVEQTAHKVIIHGYEPDPQGLEKNFVTFTLTQAKMSSYRIGAVEKGRFTETLHLTFATLEYTFVQAGSDYTWQPA